MPERNSGVRFRPCDDPRARTPRWAAALVLVAWVCLAGVALGASAGSRSSGSQARPIGDASTRQTLLAVQEQVENLRGIRRGCALPASYLDSATLKHLVEKAIEEELPPGKMRALKAFLAGLGLIPENLDLGGMYSSLFDEQVGGLYDTDSKRLFVRERFDVVSSPMARLILAHEICHALQDHAFGLEKLGIDAENSTDRILAATAIAEGDAMALMSEYAVRHAGRDLVRDLPGALMMDQSALERTPHFFQQQLLFPYIQGQLFVEDAVARDPAWRDRLFEDPPRTTEQLMHPERFFGKRDEPSPLFLAPAESEDVPPTGAPTPPGVPEGFFMHESDSLGEYGARLLFEERLGAGMAHMAAAGWDGDALLICADAPPMCENAEVPPLSPPTPQAWWFCWETAWDSAADAGQFARAWTTLWRLVAEDRSLGDPAKELQSFDAGLWHVHIERRGARVLTVWHTRRQES